MTLLAKNLVCEKQNRLLFADLNILVNKGELLHVKGENGAGKTSLLRILVGLALPLEGEIVINDLSVRTHKDEAHRHLVYLGHKLAFHGLLSAIENLKFWCALRQLNSDENKITNILDKLGLSGFEHTPIKYLSAGQQRRVGLASIWLENRASLWVLDEPFTSLDVDTIALIETHIRSFLASGGAVIMTSHQETSLTKHESTRVFELDYLF